MFSLSKPKRIYLDTAATTPVDKNVITEMRPFFSRYFGNPSSLSLEGEQAKSALAAARRRIAKVLDAHPDEILFTSGGTESDNLALLGVAHGLLAHHKIAQPGRIITTKIEHRAVLAAAEQLAAEGWDIVYLSVDALGQINPSELEQSLTPDTALVSIMMANNEMGAIEPLKEVAKKLRAWRKKQAAEMNESAPSRLPYLHTDACQAPRFLELTVSQLDVDLLSFNGSKIYGPKGAGALYVRRNTFISPVIVGGGQENGLRSGTENVAASVGLARALELANQRRETDNQRLTLLRDYFIAGLSKIAGAKINGDQANRLPNNVSVTFPGYSGEFLVLALDAKGIACSTGSACSVHHRDDAHVIMALGQSRAYADSTLRFSLDRHTSKADLNYVLKVLSQILTRNQGIKI